MSEDEWLIALGCLGMLAGFLGVLFAIVNGGGL